MLQSHAQRGELKSMVNDAAALVDVGDCVCFSGCDAVRCVCVAVCVAVTVWLSC